MEVTEVGGTAWDWEARRVGAGEEGRAELVGWGEGEGGAEVQVEIREAGVEGCCWGLRGRLWDIIVGVVE